MKNLSILITLVFFGHHISKANDGAFYGSGNHLIPIVEKNISVQKEILKISRVDPRGNFDENWVYLDVYYEFYNDSAAKDVLVGFEAMAPQGDVDGYPDENGEHRYMKDFTVLVNNEALDYGVTLVKKHYSIVGKKLVGDTDLSKYTNPELELMDGNYVDYDYVYYFNALFKPGLNRVRHTYRLLISGGVDNPLQVDYVLTAANRWANNQIDDFTLILDLKDSGNLRIQKTFFESADEWEFQGEAKEVGRTFPEEKRNIEFTTHGKPLVYKAKNFHPDGELKITKRTFIVPMETYRFDYEKDTALDWNLMDYQYYEAVDAMSYRIIRNLPYALKGYDFKNKQIKTFYEKQKWYKVDYSYKASYEGLDMLGKMWLEEMEFINEKWLKPEN